MAHVPAPFLTHVANPEESDQAWLVEDVPHVNVFPVSTKIVEPPLAADFV
jgi:hypothetical protein